MIILHVVQLNADVVRNVNLEFTMRRLLLILGAIIICACNDKYSANDTIEIMVDVETSQNVTLSDLKTFSFTHNNQPMLVGTISKCIVADNIYYIASNNRLMSFDEKGRFITYISNAGRANNEYIGISDFWVYDGNIYIYDMNGKKIMEFSKDNKFIKNTPLKQLANEEFIPFSHLVPLTNGYIGKCVWNGMEGSSPALAFYDSEYNYVHTLGNLTINCGLRLGYPLYKNGDDEVFYWNPLGTIIYGIDDKLEVCDKYHISFGNKTYPPLGNFVDDYELLNKYKNDNEWRTNHAGFIAYVWQIKNSLIFTYMYQDIPHLGIYNIKSKKTQSHKIDMGDLVLKQWCSDGKSIFIIGEDESEISLFKVLSI